MTKTKKTFTGGSWTDEKLNRVRKYLHAYTKVLQGKGLSFAYIDAFAGTGYRNLKQECDTALLLPELSAQDNQAFLDGSARIALQVEPRFLKYIFIEKDEQRFLELQRLKSEYPDRANDIILVNDDANDYLSDLCLNKSWEKHRAVLFLDPYGMQVEWPTIEAIAKTKAIDMWLLFPLGVAVNRLLRKDGQVDKPNKERLDRLFGTDEWFNEFYKVDTVDSLFGPTTQLTKQANFDSISKFFIKRLELIFAGVAKKPLPLYNSMNNPLYLLCFAVGNKKGMPTALKISNDILKK